MNANERARLNAGLASAFLVSFHDEGGVYLGDIAASALRSLLAALAAAEARNREVQKSRDYQKDRAVIAQRSRTNTGQGLEAVKLALTQAEARVKELEAREAYFEARLSIANNARDALRGRLEAAEIALRAIAESHENLSGFDNRKLARIARDALADIEKD